MQNLQCNDILVKNKHLQQLYIHIAIEKYHFLKFILEGYDGLAILTRLKNDLVVLRYPEELHKDLINLLSSISHIIHTRKPTFRMGSSLQ